MRLYRKALSLKRQELRKAIDIGAALSYSLFIYISLPIMPRFWERLTGYVGNFANYAAAFILGLIGLLIIFYLISNRKGFASFIWVVILASAYAWGLSRLELPIERMHFVEYGLLSLFVFRALRHNIRDRSIYFWSGLSVFCLGFLDEGIQYLLPNRVYEIKDVVVNGVAGILGLLVIGLCFRPKLGHARIGTNCTRIDTN